eukprot:scaffold317714_cov17-Tisochrysis_lutea.AAC.1
MAHGLHGPRSRSQAALQTAMLTVVRSQSAPEPACSVAPHEATAAGPAAADTRQDARRLLWPAGQGCLARWR